jgi:hypothetical protein
MIRKSGHRFSEKIMLKRNLERRRQTLAVSDWLFVSVI